MNARDIAREIIATIRDTWLHGDLLGHLHALLITLLGECRPDTVAGWPTTP